MKTVLARLLGRIHGLVSMTQQRIGMLIVQRIDAHADAGTEYKIFPADIDGFGDHAEQTIKRSTAFIATFEPQQQNDKFISAQTGDRITATDRVLDAPGNLDQYTISGIVSHAVIDELESVEVQIAKRHHILLARGLRNGLLQSVVKQRAVRQTCQRIVVSNVIQLLFVLLVPCDIRSDADIVGHLSLIISDG